MEFCALLRENGISRFRLVWDDARRMVIASHPLLVPLALEPMALIERFCALVPPAAGRRC